MALKPPMKGLPNAQPTSDFTRNKAASTEELGEFIDREDADPQAEPGAIVLLPSDVKRLSKMVGLNLFTPEQLLTRVAKLTTIAVNGREITLSPALLDRLKSRAVRKPLDEYVESEIIRLLNGAVGI